jgi:hypothetical protein
MIHRYDCQRLLTVHAVDIRPTVPLEVSDSHAVTWCYLAEIAFCRLGMMQEGPCNFVCTIWSPRQHYCYDNRVSGFVVTVAFCDPAMEVGNPKAMLAVHSTQFVQFVSRLSRYYKVKQSKGKSLCTPSELMWGKRGISFSSSSCVALAHFWTMASPIFSLHFALPCCRLPVPRTEV